MECFCAVGQTWWNPARPVEHMTPFCALAREARRHYLDTLEPFGTAATGVLYDDGIAYRGFRGMDGVTWIPSPPGFGRPNA